MKNYNAIILERGLEEIWRRQYRISLLNRWNEQKVKLFYINRSWIWRYWAC
jgi:hypothetical protein